MAWDLQIKAIESKIKMIEEYQNNEVTPIKNLRLERMNVGSEAAMKPISEPI